MNEEQQNILKNFTNLDEDLIESQFKADFEILREAWGIEISKPGCTQCIKNGAIHKYNQIATNMISHGLSIEESKQVLDKRNDLNKKHQEVAQEIDQEINAAIQELKSSKTNS
jgi:Skp family chaperone for outer membrane proteins